MKHKKQNKKNKKHMSKDKKIAIIKIVLSFLSIIGANIVLFLLIRQHEKQQEINNMINENIKDEECKKSKNCIFLVIE